MLAPNSIMSLNQGADLARWNMQRLYGTSATEAEEQVPEAVPNRQTISASSRFNALLGIVSFVVRPFRLWCPRDTMTGTAAAE